MGTMFPVFRKIESCVLYVAIRFLLYVIVPLSFVAHRVWKRVPSGRIVFGGVNQGKQEKYVSAGKERIGEVIIRLQVEGVKSNEYAFG